MSLQANAGHNIYVLLYALQSGVNPAGNRDDLPVFPFCILFYSLSIHLSPIRSSATFFAKSRPHRETSEPSGSAYARSHETARDDTKRDFQEAPASQDGETTRHIAPVCHPVGGWPVSRIPGELNRRGGIPPRTSGCGGEAADIRRATALGRSNHQALCVPLSIRIFSHSDRSWMPCLPAS